MEVQNYIVFEQTIQACWCCQPDPRRNRHAQRFLLALICRSRLDPESSVSKSQRPGNRPPDINLWSPTKEAMMSYSISMWGDIPAKNWDILFFQPGEKENDLRIILGFCSYAMRYALCALRVIKRGRGWETQIELGTPGGIGISRVCLSVFGKKMTRA
jgi:hypothetical protein